MGIKWLEDRRIFQLSFLEILLELYSWLTKETAKSEITVCPRPCWSRNPPPTITTVSLHLQNE